MSTAGLDRGVVQVMDSRDADLYRKHASELIRLSSALVGPSDAEDVFVNALVRATSSSRWASLEDDARRAYLYRSVVNGARSWARSRSRRERRDELWAARRLADPELTPQPEIWEAVCALSVRQRAVVFLTYWADLTSEEIAVLLGISSGSVRRYLGRARHSLRGSLHV